MASALTGKWTKAVVFIACLGPVGDLIRRAAAGRLTANPIEYITHYTGTCILIFLALTLCVTPARKLLHLPDLIRFRRMLGLFAFFYACLHLLTYVVLDHFFDVRAMIADVLKRRYITVGLTGFLLLLPLAITSTNGWMRRLGGKNWQRLHRLIYAAAIAGVIHFYWLVKSDVTEPLRYAAVFTLLLLYRVAVLLPIPGLRRGGIDA